MGRIILLLLIFTFFNCLKKQNHKIEEPDWPEYTLEGWFVYYESKRPVKRAMVVVEPFFFVFPKTFSPEITYTDTTGFFSFGKLPPFMGYLRVYKDYNLLSEKGVVLQFDRRDTFYIYLVSQP